jgi:predicted ester cyclase
VHEIGEADLGEQLFGSLAQLLALSVVPNDVGAVVGVDPSDEDVMTRTIECAVLAVVLTLLTVNAATSQSQSTDQEKQNQEVIRRATESMNRGDLKGYVSYFAEDTKNFDQPIGREGIRVRIEDIFTTFPDYRHDIVEMIARADSVVVRCRVSGTHRGVAKFPVNGAMLVGVQPTQKHFDVQHIHAEQGQDRITGLHPFVVVRIASRPLDGCRLDGRYGKNHEDSASKYSRAVGHLTLQQK